MGKMERDINKLCMHFCPEGVDYYKLGELGKFYGGLTGKNKSDFSDGNAKFISYRNVYNNPALKLDVEDKVKISSNEKQNTLERGDIIFTGSSETADECGLSSVVTQDVNEKIYLNSFCFIFRFKNPKIILPDFSKHLFRSEYLRHQIGKTASGVTRFNVSKKLMANVTIPLPPLPIQQEIVRILDTFTNFTAELTDKLNAELTARRKQYEYYRDELLTFGEDVPRVQLGDIGPVCMCKRILKSQTNTAGGVPFYKIGTFGKTANAYISEETYQEYRSKYSFPNKGDILISAAGTIGRTVVYDGKPAYFQDSNIVWIANDETRVLNRFLAYCYEKKPWNISSGGTIARLYNENIQKAVIPAPSLERQMQIISQLEKMEDLCNSITVGLPAEITARQKQYEYYRDKLLTFKENIS